MVPLHHAVPDEPTVLSRRPVLREGVFAALTALGVLAGQAVSFPQTLPVVSPVPAVAVLWLTGSSRSRWALRTGALVCVAAVVLHLTGESPAAALALALALAVQGLASARTYRRLRPDGLRLRTASDLWSLAAGAAAGAVVSTPVVLLASAAVEPLHLSDAVHWLLHETLSVFLVLAAVLRGGHHGADGPPGARALERCAVAATLALTYVGTFWLRPDVSVAFLLLPVVVWVALRESLRAVTVHLVLLAVAVVVAVRLGHHPWQHLPTGAQVVIAEAFLGALVLTTLLLALSRADEERSARHAHEQADLLGAVFASISDAVTVVDARGNLLLRNRAADDLFGGVSIPGMADPSSAHGFFRLDGTRVDRADLPVVRALHGRPVVGVEGRLVSPAHPDGQVVSVSAHPLPPAPGAAWDGGAVAALHDLTALRAATEEVARAHDLIAGVLDAATEHAIVAVDTTGRITLFNEGAERMLGWDAREVIGRPVDDLHEPGDLQALAHRAGLDDPADLFTTSGAGGAHTFRCRYRRRDGSLLTVSLTSAPLHDGDGRLGGFMTLASDITAQLDAEQRIAESEALFRAAFERNPTGIVLVAVDPGPGGGGDGPGAGPVPGRILRANRSMRGFARHPQASLPGTPLVDLVEPAAAAAFTAQLRPVAAGTRPAVTFDSTFLSAGGRPVVGEVTATLLHSRVGEPMLLCLLEDVGEQRAAEAALAHQARHDALTGLANRTLLRERLAREVAVRGRRLGLLYVDLDGFKAVNDSAGHAAGDQLLVVVASALGGCVRAGDTVARLGGDEFALLCPGATRAETVAVGQRVLDALERPIVLDGIHARVGASIGVRWFAGTSGAEAADGGPDASAERLLDEADAAMYAAKRAGKGRIVVHGE